jgi:hypothetical protein
MDHERKGGQKCVSPRNKQGRKRNLPWAKRPKLIAIIDEGESTQKSLLKLLESAGFVARCFGSAEEFLESDLHREVGCLIAEIQMPGISFGTAGEASGGAMQYSDHLYYKQRGRQDADSSDERGRSRVPGETGGSSPVARNGPSST